MTSASYSFQDKSDKTARAEGRPLPGFGQDDVAGLPTGGDGAAAAAAEDADIKQVTVRFAKGDADMAKKMRER